MPPKKTLKTMGKKKAPSSRRRSPYYTPKTPRTTGMRIEMGHGVQPGYSTGQPGGFQQASNPFQTPVPHNVSAYSRYAVYTGGNVYQNTPAAGSPFRPVNLNAQFEETFNNTANGAAYNDFNSRPPQGIPDTIYEDHLDHIALNMAEFMNETADYPEIIGGDHVAINILDVPVGNLNGEGSSYGLLQAEMETDDAFARVLDREFALEADDQFINWRLMDHYWEIIEKGASGMTEEDRAWLDANGDEVRSEQYALQTLLQAERERDRVEDRMRDPFGESQARIHQGEGGASATLIEQRRADGHLRDDPVVNASVNQSSGSNSQYTPIPSLHTDPNYVHGRVDVPTTSRQGHENGRERIGAALQGMPVVPGGQDGHQEQVSYNTPALINTSNSSTAANPMYTGASGAGATIPATGGYVNITPPTAIPTLMDLAPAADLPIRTAGPAALSVKSPAAGTYWNASRHGVAVYA